MFLFHILMKNIVEKLGSFNYVTPNKNKSLSFSYHLVS